MKLAFISHKALIPKELPDILVAVHIEERIDGRVEVAEPPNDVHHIVGQHVRVELAQRVDDGEGQPANGECGHKYTEHARRFPVPLEPQVLVLGGLHVAEARRILGCLTGEKGRVLASGEIVSPEELLGGHWLVTVALGHRVNHDVADFDVVEAVRAAVLASGEHKKAFVLMKLFKDNVRVPLSRKFGQRLIWTIEKNKL